ncbi:hypothetical protein TYRP_017540 [Tyrophagus putrescentiae]|nr:hypothetical protein TYRP_017540 [Tyrophagus putrescentiae]
MRKCILRITNTLNSVIAIKNLFIVHLTIIVSTNPIAHGTSSTTGDCPTNESLTCDCAKGRCMCVWPNRYDAFLKRCSELEPLCFEEGKVCNGQNSVCEEGRCKCEPEVRKYNCRSKSGLYSLKKHEADYARSKGPDGYHYKCVNCDEYTTKSQATMVRHTWTHKKQHFRCDNCFENFENEFSLYKHKKTTHPETTSQHNRASSKGNKEKREAAAAAAAALLLNLFVDLRHGLKEARDQAQVGHLEDGRLGVLVDGHDGLRVLHAGQVLDGAADAHRHVQLRRHDLARLADLQVVRDEAGVDGRSTGAHRRVELVGQLLSPLFMPRPPLMTRLAAVSSGRSDLVSSALMNSTTSGLETELFSGSEGADPPPTVAASKDVPRTVRTFTLSSALIVCRALPA